MDAPPATASELRAAQVAHVLARAVREKEIAASDALRILRHELRRRNTNKKEQIVTRSRRAQQVIEQYGAGLVPKNSSPDALHADHVYPLTVESINDNRTAEEWLAELRRVAMVVCVTAEENYRLEAIERAGVTGPEKYAQAEIEFTDAAPPRATSPPTDLQDVKAKK